MGFKDRFKKIFRQDKNEDDEIFQENGIVEFDSSANEIAEKDLEVVSENELSEFDLSPNLNVLFVCSGNTDRSPIAEAIFNCKATDQKAFSAGMNAYNGSPASDNAVSVCANHGIDLSGHRARNIAAVPVHEMDLVLAATTNFRDALKMQYPDLAIFTIREFAGDYSNLDIEDPIGGDLSAYEKCFRELDEAISRIIDADAEVIARPAEINNQIIARPNQIRNFRYLDNLIHSGVSEIVLDSDIILGKGEESLYPEGIILDVDGLIIDGNGHAIDGDGKARIFSCVGEDITLKSMALKNAYCESGGGAILNEGKLNIQDSVLADNQTLESGGAIFNVGGELTIDGCEFENNSARYGGAIRNFRGTLNMSQSSLLTNNRASSSGGAISNVDESNIEDTTIVHNTANTGGGITNNGKMTIRNSILRKNKAKQYYGGAIDNGEYLTVIDSIMVGNIAERDGGAIHNNCADLTLIGSSFSGNVANERGDAVFNYRERSFKVENCDLKFWDVVKYDEYDGGD